uniref:Pyrroline-5-carboxylate reductase dimerisation domain-containing protein n=1 Tax=Ditylenchus dipsaci TaxID=166011 RepID=A0A915DSF5_9BILA
MIEGLADGGVKQGLPRELSLKLACYTVLGAAKMVLETGEHPAILKEAVQSPGGSSVYGLHELEKGAMRSLLMNAVEAASQRSRNTGQELLPRQPVEDEEDNEQGIATAIEEEISQNRLKKLLL